MLGATAALSALVPAAASAAQLTATPSNLGTVFSSAQAGDTILLASGDYGTFNGGVKSGRVTIQPADGATASLKADLTGSANLTLDGLVIKGLDIGGTAHDLTVRNSRFTGRTVFRPTTNANILLDGNTHLNMDVCSGCYAGRIQFAERNESSPSGVTISNSKFAGGSADGIQNGSNGTRIIGNEFYDLGQGDASIAHTDAIQLYGSKNTVIRGNYFHGVSVAIGGYDEVDHEVIEDNVIVADGSSAYVMQLLSDNGSVIRHNTFARRSSSGGLACAYNVPCGTILLGNKSVDPRSTGTVLKDNILTNVAIEGSVPSYATEDFNLFAGSTGSGPNDSQGSPTYVGGDTPSSLAGFALASGSAGKGNASDGLDRGARITASGGTTTPPPPPPPPPPPTTTTTTPACSPTCDQQIATLEQTNSDLQASLDATKLALDKAQSKLARIGTAANDGGLSLKSRLSKIRAILAE